MWKNKPWLFQVEGGEGGGAESASSGDGADGGEQQQNGESKFTPITSQADLNKLISERVSRERAKYSDYNDLKSKAAEFDKIAEANKTELQKAQEAQKKLEDELNSTRTSLLRRDVAAKYGITDKDDIELFLTGTDESTLSKQAKRLAERTPIKKGNRVSREGTNPKAGDGEDAEERQAVQSLFG